MRRVLFRSLPSWKVVEDFVKSEIKSQWYAIDLSTPYTSFITRARLAAIWGSQLPHQRGETPFTAFCRYTTKELAFDNFCDNIIQLTSALLYVGWDRITSRDSDCTILWTHSNQCRIGIRHGSNDRWADLSDEDLPLTEEHIRLLFSAGQGDQIIFRDTQFSFKPLVISAGTLRPKEYPVGTRLPFESVKAITGRKGWYGDVDAVRIVEEHIEWERPEEHYNQKTITTANQLFACKTFRVPDNFFEEHDRLVAIGTNSMHEERIMMHIAAFVVGSQFKILFPWAWADLNHFFGMNPSEYPLWLRQSAVSPYSLLKEGQSLGHALAFLHEGLRTWDYGPRSLFHMDLKSDNILVVSPSELQLKEHPLGVWKITDFGLSDFGITNPNTDQQFTMIGDVIQSIQSTGSRPHRQVGPFQAPEAERPPPGGIDQAKADVWSFGCVAAEILAFSALGPQGIRKLRRCLLRRGPDSDQIRRSGYFYTCSEGGRVELVPALNEFLNCPYDTDHAANTWFTEMWQFISTTSLSIQPQNRPKVGDFCDELRRRVLVSSTPTPRECLFAHAQPLDEAASPTSTASREAAVHLSEPTTRIERSPTGYVSMRSSSSPPQPVFHSPSSVNAGLRLRVESGLSPAGTEYHSPIASTPARGYRAQQNTPSTPRHSGSISTTDSPLQQWISSPVPHEDPTQSMELTIQVKSLKLKPEFVALSPDGASILFSDGRHIAWSQLPQDFSTPILASCDLETRGRIGLASVHPTMLSALIKKDNTHIVLQSFSNEISPISPRSLNHITCDREVRAICISSAQCVALEFPDTIKVFDSSGQSLLEHRKHQRDLVLDLTFDNSGAYLFAISSDQYWVWQHNEGDHDEYVPLRNDNLSLETCISGFQQPKIITMKGSKDFLVQDIDRRDGHVNIAIIDDNGPRKQKLKSNEGSIESDLCMTLDNQELFALVFPNTNKRRSRQSPIRTIQRWVVTNQPRIVIEAKSPVTPPPEVSIGKSSFYKPGTLAIAPLRLCRRNYALVARYDGRVSRTPLDGIPSSTLFGP